MPEGSYITSYDFCPSCGQQLEIPAAITKLHLPGAVRLILFQLYRANGQTLTEHQLNGGRKATSLKVRISRLRTALRDSGFPYKIETIHGEGYKLVRLTDDDNRSLAERSKIIHT